MIAESPDRRSLDQALQSFGHAEFRPGQREAIETLLEARRLLLVAPTGGGKSLIYQLPASILPGTTLVVSPLISLMQDQVEALEAAGISCTFLASTLESAELRQRIRGLADGKYKLVYVAPERLGHPGFRAVLDRLDCPLVAIDEAHCISEWGHDFRPDYLEIGAVLRALPEARVLACTATATPEVRDEIVARLDLGSDTPEHVRGFARPNLVLRAREVSGSVDRRQQVDLQLAEALGGPGDARGAAIIYSPTRRMSEAEAQRLQTAGWSAACYHAGLDGRVRERTQRAFSEGQLEVVVATNAFGMGIDRADVRAVIHLGPPGSIESYYQEVGRAGRDGERAFGLLLSSTQDLPRRRRLIESSSDGEPIEESVVEHKWNLFLELMRWCEGGSCRHDAILRYFGADADRSGTGCGICDVCESLESEEHDPEQVTLLAQKALSAVARVNGRFGLTAAAKLLKGGADPRFERTGLDCVSTFGILKEEQEAWLVRLLRRCVTAGWVSFSAGDRPVVLLTERGKEVMTGRIPARFVPPPRRVVPAAAGSRRTARVADLEELDEGGRVLFEALRAHRLAVARKRSVLPYVVASDRTLRELARQRPRNRTDLLSVYGIGPSRVRDYGDGFLAVIASSV